MGTGSDGGSDSSDSSSSGGSAGGDEVLTGIPCGQILDCFGLCDDGDEECFQECYSSAHTDSQGIFDDLDACYAANGCTDWWCMEEQCPGELAACEDDVPPGGHVCTAEGVYEICSGGYCDQYLAAGAGWGSTEAAAGFWSEVDCSEFMTSIVILNSTTSTSAAVVQSCSVAACGGN